MEFGIEHEIALLREGEFLDFTNSTFDELNGLLEDLPDYSGRKLRIDRFKIMAKRWYVEGYERFTDQGELAAYLPKGLEIRTEPKPSIKEAIENLRSDFARLNQILLKRGYSAAWISYHPFRTDFFPKPPFSKYEREKFRSSPEDRTAHIAQLSFGPDLSISFPDRSDDELLDLGRKLIYTSPFIVPYSFSSPFYKGSLWQQGGLSVRSWIRTGLRRTVRVFLRKKNAIAFAMPARSETEIGRVEFKAFDTCRDPQLYGALFALLKGLLLDRSISSRLESPDIRLHRRAAIRGFDDRGIKNGALQILKAARQALTDDADAARLETLEEIARTNAIPGKELISSFRRTNSISQTLAVFPSLT